MRIKGAGEYLTLYKNQAMFDRCFKAVGLLATTNLQDLDLTGLPVIDLTPLSTLTNLEILYLNNTPVTDLYPLSFLPNLGYFDLSDTRVTDLRPLAALTNLRALYLKGVHADRAPIQSLIDAGLRII